MEAAAPRRPFFVMNPRSGGGKVRRFGLQRKAEQLGATVLLLGEARVDLAGVLHRAVDDGADLLGAAGGDGTLGIVADVAVQRDVPFLVVPAGTRNHFAMDLGLDRAHPDAALDALTDGEEILVDLGTAAGRRFVNTASFGAYAELVKRPDYRNDKLRVTLDALPELLAGHGHDPFSVRASTFTMTDPTAALVSNNPYNTADVAGLDRRPRLDTGALGLICVRVQPPTPPRTLARPLPPTPPVVVTTATTVVVDAPQPTVAAAIDGETVVLEPPVICRLAPRALRVRLPRQRVHSPVRAVGRRRPAGASSSKTAALRSS